MAGTEVKYIVKSPFKYEGVKYKRGDEWEPNGGKWDDIIIRHHVTTERVVKSPAPSGGKVRVKHAESA